MADIENGHIPTAGHVLSDGAVLVLEGHLPATEGHHAPPIVAVPGVQRAIAQDADLGLVRLPGQRALTAPRLVTS